MFTGLIEEIGKVVSVQKAVKSSRITIAANETLKEANRGDSISTNGVCLTIAEFSDGCFCADVMAETMRRSNLSHLCIGDPVNLERALRVGDRLGGHIVSGHIDGMGSVVSFKREENAVWITVAPPRELLRYIVQKGSIAIDGVSLTVANVDQSIFQVSIIPHTKDVTTLLGKKVGEPVNLECDVLGKYIEKLLYSRDEVPVKQTIDMNFLGECGFL